MNDVDMCKADWYKDAISFRELVYRGKRLDGYWVGSDGRIYSDWYWIEGKGKGRRGDAKHLVPSRILEDGSVEVWISGVGSDFKRDDLIAEVWIDGIAKEEVSKADFDLYEVDDEVRYRKELIFK